MRTMSDILVQGNFSHFHLQINYPLKNVKIENNHTVQIIKQFKMFLTVTG